jgi:hypothetical protein
MQKGPVFGDDSAAALGYHPLLPLAGWHGLRESPGLVSEGVTVLGKEWAWAVAGRVQRAGTPSGSNLRLARCSRSCAHAWCVTCKARLQLCIPQVIRSIQQQRAFAFATSNLLVQARAVWPALAASNFGLLNIYLWLLFNASDVFCSFRPTCGRVRIGRTLNRHDCQ